MTMTQERTGTQSSSFALDNVTYDLITILHEKSKGLEAYDKYMQDAQGDQELNNILQQIRQQDTQFIQQLQELLA